ncbi:MAG: hypothetical protein RIM84_10765 [Alphaproteobacteria bacterium]
MTHRLIRHLFALLLMAGLAAPALAAEKLKVKAVPEDGFARLTFEWSASAALAARLFEDRLIVTYDRAFDADYEAVVKSLPGYLKDVAVRPDRQTVVFGLARQVRLRQTGGARLFVVDLIDDSDAASETSAASTETVTVRGGDHPNFGRLVFDWRRIVAFEVDRLSDTVTVTFAAGAELDGGSLSRQPPYGIKRFETARADGQARAILQVVERARIRHFRAGTKFVLDVLPPADAPKLTEVYPQQDKPASARKTAAAPTPPAATAKPGSAPAGAIALWRPTPLREPAAKGGFVRLADGAAAAKRGSPTPLVPKARTVAATVTDKAQDAGEDKAAATAKDDGPTRPETAVADDSPGGGLKLSFSELAGGSGANMSFEWPAPVPAGAFLRGESLWLVFDRPDVADLTGIGQRDGAVLAAQQMRNNRAVILRLTLAEGMAASLTRDRATWNLAIRPAAPALQAELAVLSQPFAQSGPRVFVPVVDTGKRIVVFDPEVGDELQVVPLLPSGHGVPTRRRFAEFAVLASLQGVVVRPFGELLQVLPMRNGVAIAGKRPIRLSNPDVAPLTQSNTELSLAFKGPLLQLRSWRGDPKLPVVERHQRMQKLLARAPRGGRNVARWELARFYVALGMAPEALAVTSLMLGDDEQVLQDPMFRALRGIANLLLHRLDAAEQDLLHPDLDRFPDVALWRGMLHSRQEKFADAMAAFAVGIRHLDDLYRRQRKDALIDWAQAAVGTDDKAAFKKAVVALRAMPRDARIESYVNLWEGTLAEADGDLAGALARYNAAIAGDYRPARARAALAAADVALQLKKIPIDEAIAQLERLHFGWRGDDFEVRLRQRLAQLRLEKKEYRKGMEQMRQALINLPDAPGLDDVSRELNAVFEELFLAGKADELSPVEALALYYEFEELTPVGRKGDKLISDLVERLASVDLLDRAARLLEHQIAYRLQSQEKSQAGARLAGIYLADRQPQKALDALRKSRWQLNPAPLQAERIRLEAKALADNEQEPKALALLGEDISHEADLIRADIHWKKRDWPAAADQLDGMLGTRWQDETPLSEMERLTVVKLAIARYLSDDDAGVATVRDRYADKMAEGVEADTFALLTGVVDPTSVGFRELGKKIASLDQVDAFMASYRANHAGGATGAAIN